MELKKLNISNIEKQFDLIKKQALAKLDKSTAGQIDKKIQNLCNIINSRNDMFTLSSCSGRFSINKVNNFKKQEKCWLYSTHDLVKQENLNFLLNDEIKENKLELRCEAMILHVCIKNFQLASNLMHQLKQAGCNQVGIIAFKSKIVVEIICDAKLITPIFEDTLLVNQNYLSILIDNSNQILKRSWEVIGNLENVFRNLD